MATASQQIKNASRLGTDQKPRTAMLVDEDDELYGGFNEVAPALDTKNLREDQAFQETLRTAGMGRKAPSRMGTGMFRLGTVSMRAPGSRAGTAARPMTAVRAAGYTSVARDTPSREEKREESIEDRIKQMETRIMSLVEESCMLSARIDVDDDTVDKKDVDMGQALAKAQEASTLERQLIRVQEQANLGDTHNLDLTFAVLCNLAGQYALNEMYTETLNTYQLLTRNKLFPHANRLKVNMGNIYFKMGEHPKALKLYRMALDQTPTAEKDLRMKVMHNIGLLLVRMGKFRDAVTNFQHIMHEQGDFQTGLHLVLCSVALNDAEGGKAAFHAMLDVDPPTDHLDLTIDDESDAQECVVRDVVRGDALAGWARREAARAQRCLLRAAHVLRSSHAGNSWCIEALRNYNGGSAGARLELSSALSALRRSSLADGHKALQRLKAATRAHHSDRVLRAEAEVDSAFVAYSLGLYQEAKTLSEAAVRDDPYSCPARICNALSTAQLSGEEGWSEAVATLTAATQLDPADVLATYNLALAVEKSGADADGSFSAALATRARGAGGTLRALSAAAAAAREHDPAGAEHWYSLVGGWDCGVAGALAQLHSHQGDAQPAKHHYQDIEAAWPCELGALEWLCGEAAPDAALAYCRRAARVQPNHPKWGLLMGQCLRASGKYQEALTVYKKMNSRFPDNVQCLKLIVKLCGDQGLSETAAWARELQRAQARLKQLVRAASVASTGSASSGASHSPIDQVRGSSRVNSAAYRPATGASRQSSGARVDSAYTYSADQEPLQPINRSTKTRSGSRKKPVEDFDDDLPLPPE